MATDLTALTTTVDLAVLFDAAKALDLSIPKDAASKPYSTTTIFGTGAGKADMVWHDRNALVGGASVELDLAGALTNAFGTTVTFANVKTIVVANTSDKQSPATTAAITVGGAAANAFLGPFGAAAHTVTIPSGGFFAVSCDNAAGWAVTAGTADLVKILNEDGANSAQYDVFFIGEST